MQDQALWLEAQPWVTRYAWYATWSAGPACPNCTGALFTTTAPYDLTRLGQYYASVGQPSTPTPTSNPINTPTPSPTVTPRPTATPTPPVSACPWDINADRVVNQGDLTLLNNCYRPFDSPVAGCQVADLNYDNVVNALDYSKLLAHWGSCP